MSERFTTDARAVVAAAVTEAAHRGDRHIGTEHLCLRSALALDQVAMRTDLERRLAAAT